MSLKKNKIAAIHAAPPTPPYEYLQAIELLTAKVAALETRGRRPRDPKKHPVCYYHFRFKEKARKCEPPCSFKPGNE